MDATKMVRLKNGVEEPDFLVAVVMISLKGLMGHGIRGATQLYDLAMICRDSSYVIGEENLKVLKDLSLLESNGRPHDSVKNVVLSAVSGDGMGMKILSPIKTE